MLPATCWKERRAKSLQRQFSLFLVALFDYLNSSLPVLTFHYWEQVRSMVLLELARLEEFTGRISEARGILERARRETRHEWKVFLESVLLELRNDNIPLGPLLHQAFFVSSLYSSVLSRH